MQTTNKKKINKKIYTYIIPNQLNYISFKRKQNKKIK